MKNRSRRGCFVVGGFIALLILLMGAGWWFLYLESVLKESSKIGEWLNSPKLTRPI